MKENFNGKQDYKAPVVKTFVICAGNAMLQTVPLSGPTGEVDPWEEDDDLSS